MNIYISYFQSVFPRFRANIEINIAKIISVLFFQSLFSRALIAMRHISSFIVIILIVSGKA